MPTCTKCEATSAEDATYCGACGATLTREALGAPHALSNAIVAADPAQRETPLDPPVPPKAGTRVGPFGTMPIRSLAAHDDLIREGRSVPARTLSERPSPLDPAASNDALGPAGAALADAPAEPPKPKHLSPGTIVDQKYAILGVLAEGGMGVLYLARDVHTGLEVVVKAVRSELAHREDVRARTLAEGRALAQIDHPNVVHLRAVAVEGPHLYLVMQYIEGEGLDRIIARHNREGTRLPIQEALGIFRQVCAGVGAAHREGVIHRDLKPANVLIRKKDRVVKVTDFGIAILKGDTQRPQTRGIVGSLWYMSPEQVTGRRDLDLRVDVYALGILLYQMLVGRVPFDAKSDYDLMRLQAEAPMPLVRADRPEVPSAVDDLIQRATAKDRDQRFQSCDELLLALAAAEKAVGEVPVAAVGPAIPLTKTQPDLPLVAIPRVAHTLAGEPRRASTTLVDGSVDEGAHVAPIRRKGRSILLRGALAVVVVAAVSVVIYLVLVFANVPGLTDKKKPKPVETSLSRPHSELDASAGRIPPPRAAASASAHAEADAGRSPAHTPPPPTPAPTGS